VLEYIIHERERLASLNRIIHKICKFNSKNGENDRVISMAMIVVRELSLKKYFTVFWVFFVILNLPSVFLLRVFSDIR
jgi:hypothetical protein